MTIKAACEAAEYSEAGWHLAMKRPHVKAHLEAVQAQFIREIDRRRATYRAQAIEVAHDLMHNGTSEAVRMRAVEFFAGEARSGPQVNVQINQNAGNGYEYVRPGQVVEIIDTGASSPDGQSGAQHEQDPEE